ncbi:hypothetical protein GF336_04480 [Candidatus Woesearchaeota archaeon]|nr:hypothetical protein [Candidatus Woesearchaeota archaeon]
MGFKKKFVIIGDARTGTTMLRGMLNQHPDINCEDEIISNDGGTIVSNPILWRFRNLIGYIAKKTFFKRIKIVLFLSKKRKEKVIGFKALYEQISKGIESFLLKRNFKVILIIRKDKIRRALSEIKAKKTGVWNVVKEKKEKIPKNNPINVDFEELKKTVETNLKGDNHWKKIVERENTLLISYEDLVKDKDKNLGVVLESLGFNREDARNLTPSSIKLSKEKPISSMIDNYDEILNLSEGTFLKKMLIESE